jgi:hypothetical protein
MDVGRVVMLGDKHPPLRDVRQWGVVTNGVGPISRQAGPRTRSKGAQD